MKKNIYIKNLNGTGELKPGKDYESWIDYWEKRTGRVACMCAACGSKSNPLDKTHNGLVGAHVQKVFDLEEQCNIVPLCESCNHREDWFRVPEERLVLAPPSSHPEEL